MKELPTMQELQSFITYNKTGSFTLAAQTMNITQSAFSAQIKFSLHPRQSFDARR